MAEETKYAARPTDPLGRALYSIARVLAVLGGVLLSLVALLTTVSVFGRFFGSPIPGDFELVAIGTGVSVFAMMPYCQMIRGNVLVDFFMDKAPVRAKTACDTLGAIAYLVIGYLLTWRMIHGGIEMYEFSEKSVTINFPRWTTFPISVLFMGLLVVVIAYTVGRSVAETRAGRYFGTDRPSG